MSNLSASQRVAAIEKMLSTPVGALEFGEALEAMKEETRGELATLLAQALMKAPAAEGEEEPMAATAAGDSQAGSAMATATEATSSTTATPTATTMDAGMKGKPVGDD